VIVRLSSRAIDDLEHLRGWLSERSRPAAVRAVESIVASLAMIERFPEHGRQVRGAIRETFVNFGRDGFVIRYRLNNTDGW
jgi:plasmid stabilization system protein ParE